MLKIARDLVQKISLFCSLESAIIDKLEELEKEQYKIREDHKRLTGVNRSLERQYSELLMAFGSVKKDMPEEFHAKLRPLQERLLAIESVLSRSPRE